jgi:hypothetical protein
MVIGPLSFGKKDEMNTHMLQNVIHTAAVAEKKVWEKIHHHIFLAAGLLLVGALLIVALLSGLPQRLTATVETEAKPLQVYNARDAMDKAIVLPAEAQKPARALVYDATSAMQKSVVNSWEARPASRSIVYDATTAMQEAVVNSWEARPASRAVVYDATAAMQNSVVYSWQVRTPLVYDATAAMFEAVVFPSSDR